MAKISSLHWKQVQQQEKKKKSDYFESLHKRLILLKKKMLLCQFNNEPYSKYENEFIDIAVRLGFNKHWKDYTLK